MRTPFMAPFAKLICAIAIVASFAGCPGMFSSDGGIDNNDNTDPDEQPLTGTFEFGVYDSVSGLPVEGVTLGFGGLTGVSDGAGTVIITSGSSASIVGTSNATGTMASFEIRGAGTYESMYTTDLLYPTDTSRFWVGIWELESSYPTVTVTPTVTLPDTESLYFYAVMSVLNDNGGHTRSIWLDQESTDGTFVTFDPVEVCANESATIVINVKRLAVDSESFFEDETYSIYHQSVDLTSDRVIHFDLNDADQSVVIDCPNPGLTYREGFVDASVHLQSPTGSIPILEYAEFYAECPEEEFPALTEHTLHFNNPGGYSAIVEHYESLEVDVTPSCSKTRYCTSPLCTLSGRVTVPDVSSTPLPSVPIEAVQLTYQPTSRTISITEHESANWYGFGFTSGDTYLGWVSGEGASIALPEWFVAELAGTVEVSANVMAVESTWRYGRIGGGYVQPEQNHGSIYGWDCPSCDPPIDSPYVEMLQF